MKYKKISTYSYNLHIIKTKKFKTVTVQVGFKRKLNKEEITYRNMIVNMLTDLNAEQMLLFSMVNKYNFIYNNCRQLLFFKTVNFILYFYF